MVDLASNGPLRSLGDIDSNSVEFEPVLGSLCAIIDPVGWDARDVDADIDSVPGEDEVLTEGICMEGALTEERPRLDSQVAIRVARSG